MLLAQNLVIGYKGSQPLTPPLNLQAGTSQCIALVGQNGSGKTTLLRTLCGLQKPISGQISWNGKPLAALRPKQLARHVSIVFTKRPDTFLMRTEEVVALGRLPHHHFLKPTTDTDRTAISQAITLCRIAHLKDRQFSALSDGQQQRVLLARAIATQTPVILLDEPTAFLDTVATDEILNLLQDLSRRQKKLIIFTTHHPTAALQADTIWTLSSNGINIQSTSTQSL